MLGDVHVVAQGHVFEHALEHVGSLEKGIGYLAGGHDLARADEIQDILQPVGELADVHEIEKLGRSLYGVGRPEDPVDDLGVDLFHLGFYLDEILFDVCNVLS